MTYIRNKTTGEIRNVNDSELPTYGIGQDTTLTENSSSNTGVDPNTGENLRKLLLIQTLQDPKNASLYASIGSQIDKIYPQKEKVVLKGKPQTDVNLARNVITSAQEASKILKPEFTGPKDTLVNSIKTVFNAQPQDYTNYKQYVSDIRTAVRNYISGTAVSSKEGQELMDLLPKNTDSDSQVREKLSGIQRIFLNKTSNVLSTAGIDQTAEDYLKTKVVDPQTPEQKPAINVLLDLLPGAGGALGSIGGGFLGGAAGSVVPGAGTAAGSILGAGAGGTIGGSAGYAIKDLLSQLLNVKEQQDKTSGQKLTEALGEGVTSGVMGAGGEAVGLGAQALLKGLLSGGVKTLNPGNALKASGGAIREGAIETAGGGGKILSGTKYANTAKAVYQDIVDSGQETKAITRLFDKAQEFAGKEISPDKAFKLYEQFDKGYTSSSKAARGAVAEFHKIMRDYLKSELSDITGGQFAKGTGRIATGYKVGNAIDKSVGVIPTAASTALLYKYLFGRGQNY